MVCGSDQLLGAGGAGGVWAGGEVSLDRVNQVRGYYLVSREERGEIITIINQ